MRAKPFIYKGPNEIIADTVIERMRQTRASKIAAMKEKLNLEFWIKKYNKECSRQFMQNLKK